MEEEPGDKDDQIKPSSSPVGDIPNHVRQSGTNIGGHQEHIKNKQQIRTGVNPERPVRSKITWGQEAGLELQHKCEGSNQKTGLESGC